MNNKLFIIKIIPYFFASLLITSCGGDTKPKKVEKPSLNIMILLDLSDRLIKQDGQASRDKDLIQYICSKMPIIIREGNGMKRSKEVLNIQIADQDNIPYSSKSYSDSLYFKMSKDVKGGFPAVRKIMEEKFPRNLDRLYESAKFSNDADDYSGANISRYFINDLKDDIKSDSMSINVLFIFTDGYVVVGERADAMLPLHSQFPELKVMVLETAPRNQDYESERLQETWDSWFKQMGVQGYIFKSNRPHLDAIKDDISKFLAGTLELTIPGNIEEIIESEDPPYIPISNPSSEEIPTQTTEEIKPVTIIDKPEVTTTKTITFPNGDVYVGELINEIPNGWGKKTYRNATRISENDLRGQRVEAGDYLEGIWKNGEFSSGKRYNRSGEYIKNIYIGSD